jgi:diguanylate cyclase (GGDEF)-like protein
VATSSTNIQAQQLVELLAVVSSCQDEASATVAAVERAAQALEAEVSALIVGDQVVTSVGFGTGTAEHDVLIDVAHGQRGRIEIPGIGSCAVGAARLGDAEGGELVIARRGDDDFTVEEYNLIRGMARVLGLTLRMLRTLDAERRRHRLMRQLHGVQRAISRRVPLQQILEMVVTGTREILGSGADTVGLWLLDGDAPGQVLLVSTAGLREEQAGRLWRMPLDQAGAVGSAIATDHLVQCGGYRDAGGTLRDLTDGALGHSMAAPVHENGTVAGCLVFHQHGDDRAFSTMKQEKLLAFAEHVSLAITDARTVREMNEAMHDSLTGLASRALFLDRLQEEVDRSAGRTVVLFVDLDRFKQVNDTFGHAAGDVLLISVAERLQGVIRDRDVPARFGGDEFAVMLRDVPSVRHAVEAANRIVAALSAPYPVPGGAADISASIGIAVGDPTGLDADEMMRRGDVAMYQAKRNGRGCVVVFEAAMDTNPGNTTLEADVRRAINHLTNLSPGAYA